jgi:hypothetical protein
MTTDLPLRSTRQYFPHIGQKWNVLSFILSSQRTVLLTELQVVFMLPYVSHHGGSIGKSRPHNKRQNGGLGKRCGGPVFFRGRLPWSGCGALPSVPAPLRCLP